MAPSRVSIGCTLTRGRYLVEGIAACGNCHSPRDDQGFARHEHGLVGSARWQLPTATVLAPNITPDVETGIGSWTDAQIARAIREGLRRDGSALRPTMDHASYRRIDAHDMRALIAYLRSLEPLPFPGATAAAGR